MVIIGTLSPPPCTAAPPLSLSHRSPRNPQAPPQTQTSDPNLSLKLARLSSNNRNRSVVATRATREERGGFLDENGVVDDMDGYLNHLSLEYDTVWDTKPAWCQPWTIVLTGVSVIGLSWVVLESAVITTMASSLIGAWWYIFLYAYPKSYADMIAERRKKVTSGVEDTFGMGKRQ